MRIPRPSARVVGAALCFASAALLAFPRALPELLKRAGAGPLPAWPLRCMTLALGIEFLALAFWFWARASADATFQVRRWTWLRRPAQAMWLGAAALLLAPAAAPRSPAAGFLPELAAISIVWAGLELMAALPLARPFSDLSGPLLAARPWLPALLPTAGFIVMWQTAPQWTASDVVRRVAEALLLVTAVLATLRAFGRRQWATALRWLTVSESALGAALIATRALDPTYTLLLWLGACGGRSFMLAGELRGAVPRRGPALSRLWRAAGWGGSTALSWPLLAALVTRLPDAVFTRAPVRATFDVAVTALEIAAAAIAVMLTAYVSVRRMVRATERRSMVRPDASLTLSHVSAFLTLTLGPTTIAVAILAGAGVPWVTAGLALIPSLTGGALAVLGAGASEPVVASFETAGGGARRVARDAFRAVTGFERRVIGALRGVARTAMAPLRDLHTGDAQEYLLFLVGLSVLALVLPFLR